jgi:hypothetical protein
MRYEDKIAVAAYVAFLAVLVFWVLDKQVLYESDPRNWVFLVLLVLVHIGLGLAIGRPWVLLLPLLSIVMALPLGYPSANKGEPLPIWLGLLFLVPPGSAIVAIGIGLRRWYVRRTA